MARWSQEDITQIAENLRECRRVSTACRFCAGDPTLCEQSIFTLMALAAEALEQINTGASFNGRTADSNPAYERSIRSALAI